MGKRSAPNEQAYGGLFPAASLLSSIDFALDRVGITWNEAPPDFRGSWLQQSRWSADSVAAISRYLTAGQTLGAIVIARQQMEKSTLRMERERGLTRDENEASDDYIRRIWRGHLADDHHDPALIMNTLSDAPHARGPLLSILRWESLELVGSTDNLEVAATADEFIGGATRFILSYLRADMLKAASEAQDFRMKEVLEEDESEAVVSGTLWAVSAVWPLTFETLENPWIHRLEEEVSAYTKSLSENPATKSDSGSFLEFCMLQRRMRALVVAREARDHEHEFFGEEFRPETVDHLNVAASLVCELAGVLALWSGDEPTGDWLLVGSSALKAGFWVWLEDDDRSMMAARIVSKWLPGLERNV